MRRARAETSTSSRASWQLLATYMHDGYVTAGAAACTYATVGVAPLGASVRILSGTNEPVIAMSFKIAGGVYLLFLAIMLWQHAADPVELDPARQKQMRPWPAFMLGLATQLANPKVIVFFGSIFVALLPAHSPLWVYQRT